MITFVFLVFLLFFNADHPFVLDRHGYEDSLMHRAKQDKQWSMGHTTLYDTEIGFWWVPSFKQSKRDVLSSLMPW